VFDDDRYFDVFVEYAKAASKTYSSHPRSQSGAGSSGVASAADALVPKHLVVEGRRHKAASTARPCRDPQARATGHWELPAIVEIDHQKYGRRWLYCEGVPELIFTENDTNSQRLYGQDNGLAFFKDG
jgi:hypothetical protein